MSFQGRQNTIIPTSAISDVPNSLLSKRQMKAMNSRNQVLQLSASNGNVAGPSGTISFNIGTGAGQGYMKAGSAYLRFEFTPTGTTPINFNGPTGHQSCASLIRTLNLNIGGLQVEQINDYDKYYRTVQAHATNANYVEHDCQITESSSSAGVTGMTTAVTVTFTVPILSGLLNQDNHVPLFLLNSQLQLQLNLNSVSEALHDAVGPTNFVINDPVLVYEKIHCDAEFEMAVRAKLSEGGVYEIPYYSALSYRSAAPAGPGATFSQNIGVNLSSLSAVIWAHVLSPTSGTDPKYLVHNNSNDKASSRRVVRCDGEQIIQSQIYSDGQCFMELQRALGSILDTNQTTVANKDNFRTTYWVNGQSAERFSDADLCMKGRACNNIVVEEQGVTAASTVYMYLIYNAVLMVQADGSALVSK